MKIKVEFYEVNNMKKRTKWVRIYHPMISVMFHDENKYGLRYYTIEKLWRCKTYVGYGSHQWETRIMMQVRTHEGFIYRTPLIFWDDNIVDDYGKSLRKYFYESPFIDRKEKFKQLLNNLKV